MGAKIARDMPPAVFAGKLGIAAVLAGIQTSNSDDTKVLVRLCQNGLGEIAPRRSGGCGDGAPVCRPVGPLARTTHTNSQSNAHSYFPYCGTPRPLVAVEGRQVSRLPDAGRPAASAFPAKPVAFGYLIRSRSRGRLLLRPRPCRIPFSPVTTGTEPRCSLRLRKRQVKDVDNDAIRPLR